MTPDNAIWWLKLKAKQKQTQKYEGPIYQGHPLPVTDITAEPIGKGKYLAEFDKQNPRQEYKETNEYIRRFQPEKVVQKQAWRDVERNRLRDNYAESYMIRDKDLKMQQEYEKNKQNLPWWQKRVEGVNTTPQQKEQILEQQAKGRLDWSNKPLEHKAGWIASETAMALVPELFFLKGTGKGAQIAKNLSNTSSYTPYSSVINKVDDVGKPATTLIKKGINKLGNKYLPNAHKLNPYAFKPNPEAYYRGIGRGGYNQALKSGFIETPPNSTFNNQVHMSSLLDVAEQYSKDFNNPFSPLFRKKGIDNKTGYIAEIPRNTLTNPNSPIPYETSPGIYYHEFKNPSPIPIDNVKILKQHWLKGYKEIKVPQKQFKSEIDWGKWNKEIPNNSKLMKEYIAIEKTSKANGTWMKNPDGTDFPGTPEQFVQQNSSNFKNAFGNTKVLVNGRPQILTHNSPDTFSEFSLNKVNNGRLSGDGVYTFEEGALWKGMPEHLKRAVRYPAKIDQPKYGNIEYHLYGNSTNPKIGKGQFDDITKDIVIGNPTSTRVIDDISRKNIHVFPNTNQLKSAIGNNGMFDMTNPNIYKGLIPSALMTGYLKSKTNKDEKGKR